MTARWALAIAALAASPAGCGQKPARVALDVTTPGTCGHPTDVRGLRVITYGPSSGENKQSIALAGTTELADIPADTEQLGVEVVGDLGVVVAHGKSAPLDLASLATGATIPIFMAPPDGFCPTGDMASARARPIVARAGAGVLVLGDAGATGPQAATAEYYDPERAAFVPVTVPAMFRDFTGGVATPLADGRVAVTGTAAGSIAIFDPQQLALPVPLVLEPRTHHGAFALDANHLLVIGGCRNLPETNPPCSAVFTSASYALDASLSSTLGPNLRGNPTRIDASVFDLGIHGDGAHRYALAGGSGDFGTGDRFAVGDATTTTLGTTTAPLGAQVVALDGGALISAFEPDAAPQDGLANVVAPDAATPVAIASAPAVAGARLVALEDGSIEAIGGDPGGRIARYDPTTDAWTQAAPNALGSGPGAIVAPSLVRLGDGSVLVLGGTIGGQPSQHAWIFRPSLVGPASGSITALPFGSSATGVIVVPDPSTATRTGQGIVLAAGAGLSARALVGGPRMTTGKLTVNARVTTGGIALVAQQLGPGRALVAELVPGAPAVIERIDGKPTILCTGATVAAFDPAGAMVTLDVHGGTATVSIDGAPPLACDLSRDPDAGDRGQWGVAADGPGARVELVTIETAR